MSVDVQIVGGARAPIGKFGGTLKKMTAVELGGHAVRAALDRTGIPPDAVDLSIVGLARQAGNGPNPGRLIAVAGGVPYEAPAYTVQQACLSGMLAAVNAYHTIREGDANVVLTTGVEHMTSVPHLVFGARWGTRMGDSALVDGMFRDGFIDPMTGKHMGVLCDALAKRYGIGREEQDAYAVQSQERWAQARTTGADDAVIAPISDGAGATMLARDEHPRPDTTMESLAKLGPAFGKDGTVTPGNACGLADGAAAVLLASAAAVEQHGWRPLARVLGTSIAALEPSDYTIAPVKATKKLLTRLGMSVDQFDFVEINEAFAAQMLACIRDLELDPARVNVWGGAIAVGHPIGMSGTRLILNVVHQLETIGGRYGLAAICGNGGQGAAIAVERLS